VQGFADDGRMHKQREQDSDSYSSSGCACNHPDRRVTRAMWGSLQGLTQQLADSAASAARAAGLNETVS